MYNMEIKARGHGQETNIARDEAECHIRLETMPECFYFHIVQEQRCFNWFKEPCQFSAIRQSVIVYVVQVW